MSEKPDDIIDAEIEEEKGPDVTSIMVADPNFSAEKAIKQAEERIHFLDKVKISCLKMTRPTDWVRLYQGGKESFYLQSTGAEKLRGPWGIYWNSIKLTNLGTNKDPIYEVRGVIGSKLLQTEIEVLGGRSSLDKFYREQGENLDIMDVRKAAVSNWTSRAIQILVGMRNLTIEDLELGGINISKVAGVKYGQGERGAYDSSQKAESTPKLEELRKKIGAMIMEMAGGDKETAQSLLGDFTEFTNKGGEKVGRKTSIKNLTVRQIKPTYGKIKKAYETEFAGAKDE